MVGIYDFLGEGVESVGIARDRLPRIFDYALLTQAQVKLRTLKFVRIFTGSIGTKAHKN